MSSRLRYLRQLLRHPRFWTLESLRFAPRYREMTSGVLGNRIRLADGLSTYWSLRGIFLDRIYAFRSEDPAPRILDVGANVGLAVLFFKHLYPASRVTAFEPDPRLFALLCENVGAFGYGDVELISKAAWTGEGHLPFASDGADGGRLQPGATALPPVPTTRLRDYLDERVDFLKLDIEGAETAVLEDCAGRLGQVRHLFVEYHSSVGERQTLGRLCEILADGGFRLLVRSNSEAAEQPFLAPRVAHGLDLQLDIFAVREAP